MSSNESSIQHWQSIAPSEHVEIGLVHVEIAYHCQADSDDSALQIEYLKNLLRECFHTVAEHQGGKLFSWDANGGAFMFLVEDRDSYDNCCLAAIQMLEMIPFLNQDLRSSKDPACRIEVRISCDTGTVAYDPEPSNIPGDFVKNLAKHGRQVSTENRVTITDRMHRQLTRQFKGRFANWKYSTELEVDLYRTPPLHEIAIPQGLSNSPPLQAPNPEKAPKVAGDTKRPGEHPPAARRWRRRAGRVGPWQMAVIGLVALLVAQFFIIRAVFPPAPPAAAAAVTPWEEQVRSPEWITWREHVHEILSTTQLTEETLAEALRVKRPEVRNPPAAVLRHDQAMADVLQSYPRVRTLLQNRLGIYEQFLGTGFSNPVDAPNYELASLHEYLIPNLSDDDPRVWMRKIKLVNIVEALDKTIQELIKEKTKEDDTKQEFKGAIISHAEAGHRETALIRFAILNMKKNQYKGTLGRPERERVFASDLAEVWKLKVKDAAERSGYTFSDGDTFFVWVFMPAHKHEVVLATWGQVLEHLPEWMENAQNRHP